MGASNKGSSCSSWSIWSGGNIVAEMVNGSGLRLATQLTSGSIGAERKDATTLRAQDCAGVSGGRPMRNSAPWPAPGITTVVEFCSVLAAYNAHCGEVLPSKLPAMTSVGIELIVTLRSESGALGTFQTPQSSVMNGRCGASDRTEVGYVGKASSPCARI